MFYFRLASPHLLDLDDWNLIIEDWLDIFDVCNATDSMLGLIYLTLKGYLPSPGFPIDGSDNETGT